MPCELTNIQRVQYRLACLQTPPPGKKGLLILIPCPVMEIDAVGTYNCCKAMYEHCFKVRNYTHVRHMSDTGHYIGKGWNYFELECYTPLQRTGFTGMYEVVSFSGT